MLSVAMMYLFNALMEQHSTAVGKHGYTACVNRTPSPAHLDLLVVSNTSILVFIVVYYISKHSKVFISSVGRALD